ncbi:MAG: hypothetical protein WCC69_11990 [Pirellulales bacterium]
MTAAVATAAWTLAGLRSQTRCGSFEVSLDLARPAAGLTIAAGAQSAFVDHLLGLDLSANCPPSDHWVRGSDITAVYEPADPRHLRATAMWRQLACDATTAAWELIASAQTSRLDSDPAVAVVADIGAGEVRWRGRNPASGWAALTPTAILPADATVIMSVRPHRTAVLIAPHPDNAARINAVWEQGRLRLGCRLFTHQLEKGVLLRSRVLTACGPAADMAWAERLLADFAASPPPLST